MGVKRTPLQEVAEIGCFKVVIYLLHRGADLHAPPAYNRGGTALQLAAIGGYLGIATVFLE